MYEFKRVDFTEAERIRAEAHRERARVFGGALLGMARAVGRGLRAFGEAFAEAQRQQALYEELTRLSDRELRDIGINRADIPAVVAGLVGRDTDRRAPESPAVAEPAPAESDQRLAA